MTCGPLGHTLRKAVEIGIVGSGATPPPLHAGSRTRDWHTGDILAV
jgi:hypothetical protein